MFDQGKLKLLLPLLESQSSALILLDENFDFAYANGWVTGTLDLSIDDLIGKNIYDCFSDIPSRVKFAIDSAVKGGKSAVISERLNKKPLHIVNPLSKDPMASQRIYIYPINFDGKKYTKIELMDFTTITKREEHVRELAAELDDSRAKLIEKSRLILLGNMAGGVAHEINNPLAIIKMRLASVTSMMEDLTDRKREKIDKMLTTCDSTCDRIAKIVRGLLTYSAGNEGESSVKTSVFDLVNSVEDLVREKLVHEHLIFKVTLPKVDFSIDCVSADICQILLNFIENAEYESLEHKTSEIELFVSESETDVFFAVRDQTPDVAEENVAKIMDPFFTTKPFGSGTGLGLSVSFGLAKNCNGSIEYHSKEKDGVKEFVLRFPKEFKKIESTPESGAPETSVTLKEKAEVPPLKQA